MSRDILLLARYGSMGASSRIRSYQYIDALESAGLRITRCPMFSDAYVAARHRNRTRTAAAAMAGFARRAGQLLRAGRHAALWVEYELLPWLPFVFERAFLNDRPVIVDYDDAVFHRYDRHPSALVRSLLGAKIDRIMHAATVVVAGNDYLAARARDAGATRIEIVPSVIDIRRYRQKQTFASESLAVGWIGSPSTIPYLRAIEPALRAASDIRNLTITNVGGTPWFPPELAVTNLDWSEAGEIDAMLKFDVGIMPLPDNPWTRGKCGYKLIQYMGCALPVIASPVGVNAQIVEHGRSGFIASSNADWVQALRALATSPTLRESLGKAGFEKVARKYSLESTAPRLIALFEDALRVPRHA